jgi:HD-GYP domain-containing protein (c-di-GMP phosphodiesterase class II)
MNSACSPSDLIRHKKIINEKIQVTVHQFSESLGIAVDAKDSYTQSHSVEVAEVAWLLAAATGMSPEEAEWIHIGGHLHDIGKIGIPNRLLHKPGPLTSAEWDVLRTHPAIGSNILSPVETFAATGIPEIVLHHHEAYDVPEKCTTVSASVPCIL